MAHLFEGDCVGTPIKPEIGGKPVRVRWEMIVTEGPHKGKRASYSGKLDEASIKYTKRDMMAVGWQGKSSRTFIDDVKAAADKPVPFTAEIANNTYADTGKTSTWTSAKFGSAKPLEPVDDFDKVDRWLNDAGDVPSPSGGDDAPF